MTSSDEAVSTAWRRATRWAPAWKIDARLTEQEDSIVVEMRHPASAGLVLEVPASNPGEINGFIDRCLDGNIELRVVTAAPEPLEHPTLLMGLRTLTQALAWNARDLRALAFLLWDEGVLTHDETAWLAGYIADDAPMRPVSPTGQAER